MFKDDFGPFADRVWLNCSHQGPLPRVAVTAAHEAISWKVAPFPLMDSTLFQRVPARLRSALARLINAADDEIVLGNSTSYGLNVIVQAYPWREGDEVLLVENDFPASLFPWLPLRARGVTVRFLTPSARVITPDEVRTALGTRTRLLCATWVHSFLGAAIDLDAIGDICRRNQTLLVVNGSQALGARPLDVRSAPVDAVTSCGFKYLCGPYGTGFCWIRPALLDVLRPSHAYWLANMTADDLKKDQINVRIRDDLGVRAFDVFGTANFLNFATWAASVEYLLQQDVTRIAQYDQTLVGQLVEGLRALRMDVVSPVDGPSRTTIAVCSPPDGIHADVLARALQEQGVFVAVRRGRLRFSPHLYNTAGDIERALAALAAACAAPS